MTSRHQKTLEAIFDEPTRANIAWKDVEAMFRAMGAEVVEGSGSRVRVILGGVKAVFHEPHPEKEISKSAVRQVRAFLDDAGIDL
jgi:HicA-like toxin of HicAB toxin-antitoxin system